jgi:hypothetical protein
MHWFHLAQDSDQWWAAGNIVTNLHISYHVENLPAGILLASQGLCSMELVTQIVSISV